MEGDTIEVDVGTEPTGEAEPVETPEAPEGEALEVQPEGEPEVEVAEEEEGEDDPEQPLSPGRAKALREEAARYRTKAKEFEDAFDGVHEDDRAILLDAARTLATDPKAFVAQMSALIDGLRGELGDDKPAENGKVENGKVDATKYDLSDPEQLAKFLDDRDAKREAERAEKEQHAKAIEAMNTELRELGYDPDAKKGSPEARRLRALQAIALHETDYDLKRAHELLEEDRRGAVTAVAKAKKAQVDGSQPVTRGQQGGKTREKPPMYLPGSTKINPAWEAYAAHG